MLKTIRPLFLIAAGVAAVSPISLCAQTSNSTGAVFVMTNAAAANQVIAYDRAADGSLSYAGSYETGGRGSGGVNDPLVSQGSLTLSQDKSLLFAANAGSGDISVFAVTPWGLELIDRAPSGGAMPVAIAEHSSLVYVLNQGGPGSVVGFRLNFGGQLTQIPNSTKYLTATDTVGSSIAISPNGQELVVTERGANKFDAFHINSNGALGSIVTSASLGAGAFALTFAPNGAAIVSETGVAGGTNASTISSYSISASGVFTAISQSVPTLGNANCWNAVTPNGKLAYASNAGSSSLAGFSIGANGALTAVGETIVGDNPAGATNLDIAISADGKYLYTLNSGAGDIGEFAIQQSGTLNYLGAAGEFPKFTGFNGIAAY
jgi:6-phosphogluconolactonase (cycloisomerase 2 family)